MKVEPVYLFKVHGERIPVKSGLHTSLIWYPMGTTASDVDIYLFMVSDLDRGRQTARRFFGDLPDDLYPYWEEQVSLHRAGPAKEMSGKKMIPKKETP